MTSVDKKKLAAPELIAEHEKQLLDDWVQEQLKSVTSRPDLMSESELRRQSAEFLNLLRSSLEQGIPDDTRAPQVQRLLEMLKDITGARVLQGFSASEVATFIFSIKQPLFRLMTTEYGADLAILAKQSWAINAFLDKLGLYVTEMYQKSREGVISRQQQELLELSTPVVELCEGILALPLIGTLDSARTQVVMESLLQKLVSTGATMAIIDITGVPTVDTGVAKHLIKTITAARLMGADCLISGIRPAIAQTIVHLGVDLSEVTTKATLADALDLCLRRLGLGIVRTAPKQ